MKKILMKNSIFGVLQTIINVLLVFIVVPIFIKKLGSELYGVFALIMVIGNLNTLSNLGLSNALVKYIAQQGKTIESNYDIIVNLSLLVLITLPITIIAQILGDLILLNIFKIPHIYFRETKSLYGWVLWANFLLFIGQVFKSVLDALQKVYITSLQQIFYNLAYWGGILIILLLGGTLFDIGVEVFIVAFLWLTITMISAIKEWGKLYIIGISKDFRKSVKKQLSFGIKIYTSGLIGFFYEPFSKILISNFIGIQEVGFYDIILKLRTQITGLLSKIFYPLYPFIAQQNNIKVIRKYIHDLEQKTFLLILPIVVIIITLMKTLVQLWLDINVEVISRTAIWLISIHLIGSSTVIPMYQYLMAKDLAGKTIKIQMVNALVNLFVFLISVKYLRFDSVILSNMVAILSSFILILYYQKKYLNSLIFDSIQQLMKVLLLSILLLIIGNSIKILIKQEIVILSIIPIVIITISLIGYKKLNIIKVEDVKRYLGNSNLIFKKLKRV